MRLFSPLRAFRAAREIVQLARMLDDLEQRISRSFEDLVRVAPFVAGHSETVVVTAGGTATISHRLGFVPNGWFVIGRSTAADVVLTSSDAVRMTFTETATVAGTLTIWVF